MIFRRDPNRLTRKELEARHLSDQASIAELRDLLAAYEERFTEWEDWGGRAQGRLKEWDEHRCTPDREPTVLDVSRVDHPVYDAEIVEEQPALFFDQLGGRYLSKPRDHWMRTGMTTEIPLGDVAAIVAEAEARRALDVEPAGWTS